MISSHYFVIPSSAKFVARTNRYTNATPYRYARARNIAGNFAGGKGEIPTRREDVFLVGRYGKFLAFVAAPTARPACSTAIGRLRKIIDAGTRLIRFYPQRYIIDSALS